MAARREASGFRAGKGGLHQTREFPTVCAAERKLLCCWIIMRSRVGTGGGCGAMVRVSASRNQLYLHSHSDNVDKILTLIGRTRVRRWWCAVVAGKCSGRR